MHRQVLLQSSGPSLVLESRLALVDKGVHPFPLVFRAEEGVKQLLEAALIEPGSGQRRGLEAPLPSLGFIRAPSQKCEQLLVLLRLGVSFNVSRGGFRRVVVPFFSGQL